MNERSPPELLFRQLKIGDRVDDLVQRTAALPRFASDSMAGRYLVFCFFGTANDPLAQSALAGVAKHRNIFDDHRASFFGISVDPQDEEQRRVKDNLPGVRYMWDFDASVSRRCGAAPADGMSDYRQFWMVLGPSLHLMAKFRFTDQDNQHEAVFSFLDGLPDPDRFAGFEIPAPVLILPSVFEPEFCRHLIGLYDEHGGDETGVMRNSSGVVDRSMKSRRDYTVTEPALIREIQNRIHHRVVSEIARVFFMNVTRMERYIVGCYAAEEGGQFRPHRDNTQTITAHRRFAISINLNRDFRGGEVSFPEYGRRGYKAQPGWAVVFPCNALHMVSRIESGKRYAFLPFVYDDEGAKIRLENLKTLQSGR